MTPVVLITRPQRESVEFSHAIKSLGYAPLMAPLLSLETRAVNWDAAPGALIATSPQAFSVAHPAEWSHIPVFVMGTASLERARAAGYTKIISAEGDISSLTNRVKQELKPGTPVVYLRGETISHDLQAALPEYPLDEKIVYAMREASSLPEPAILALRSGGIQVVTLFSARTGEIFRRLVMEANLDGFLNRIKLLCLSPAVLESVKSLPWEEAKAACRPDREGMLAGLQTWIGNFHE